MDEASLAGSGAGTTETGAPQFEPPRVVTFRGDEIIQLLGPAQACNSYNGAVTCVGNNLLDPAKLARLAGPAEV